MIATEADRLTTSSHVPRRARGSRRRWSRIVCASAMGLAVFGADVSTVGAAPAGTLEAPIQRAAISGLSQGAQGEAVRSLQQALIDLGITVVGGADGVFGPGTRAAVEAFQRSRGIAATGTVDAATADAIEAATNPGSGSGQNSQLIGLAEGASGALVKRVQQALIDIGVYVPGGADGIFGAATTRALTQFQRWNRLQVTGTVTGATVRLLGLDGAGVADNPAPEPQPEAENPYLGLSLGASGDRVRALQRALQGAGVVVVGGADGSFGPATERALRQYQQAAGRTATGKVTAADASALGLGATPPPAPEPQPQPDNPYVGLRIGAQGTLVTALQKALIGAGINLLGGADGSFGNATKGGVVLFQQQRGLSASGVVDAATASALGLGGAPSGVNNPTPDEPTPPPSSSNPYVGLALGSKGPRVVELQQALESTGLVVRGGADGVFGPATKSALIAFQSVNAIPQTGVLTEQGARLLKLGQTGGEPSGGGSGSGGAAVTLERFPVQGVCFFGDTWHAPRGGGRLHEGVDIIANEGKLLYAVVDGQISKQYWDYPGALAGNGLRLSQDDGTYFTYLHLLDFAPGIEVGTRVKAGDVIGFVGNTGSSATAHLHFEIHPKGGKAINPYPLVKAIDGCKNSTAQYQQSFSQSSIAPADAEIGIST